MPDVGAIRFAYLSWLSKPREDRALYRLIRKRRVTSILELGVGSLERAIELIGVCRRFSPDAKLRYAAVDPFEERDADQPKLSLIEMHRKLGATGAKVHLSPGRASAVAAIANALQETDLVLIGGGVEDADLAPAWFYFPRMCHADADVLRLSGSVAGAAARYESVSSETIADLAEQARPRQAA